MENLSSISTRESTSLRIENIDPSVNEELLIDVFSQVATLRSVRIYSNGVSPGYGYINFNNAQDASSAMKKLNCTPIKGKPIRIGFSQRDNEPSIFVKHLDTSIDNKALYDKFAVFGTILSCKVVTDGTGQSKGYGFLQFEQEESAQNAIKDLDGKFVNNKQVFVTLFVTKQERDRADVSPTFTKVYVQNFTSTTTDEDLKKVFGNYGPITSAVVMRDANGNSRGCGFVNFQNSGDAAVAVDKMNGRTFNGDKVWYVGRALRRLGREAEHGANLFLRNLDDRITEESLRELFSEYGTITSCKVLRDTQGHSRGSGFFVFSTVEEATKALDRMNGEIVEGKRLSVTVARLKDERNPWLQEPILPRISGLHPGRPRLAPPQQPCSQVAPGPGSPQHAFDEYPDQLQRMGARRDGNIQGPQQMPQQLMQCNPNQGFIYPNARNGMGLSMLPQAHMGQTMPIQFDAFRMPVAPVDAYQGGPMQFDAFGVPLAPVDAHQGGPMQFDAFGVPLAPVDAHQGGPMQFDAFGVPVAPVDAHQGRPMQFDVFGVPVAPVDAHQRGPMQFDAFEVPVAPVDAQQGGPMQFDTVGMPVAPVYAQQGGSMQFDTVGMPVAPVYAQQGGPMQFDTVGMPVAPVYAQQGGPMATNDLTSALSAAVREQQLVILGERLFPLVKRLDHDHAGKITGMLLELDRTEVLHLIKYTDALKKKVNEAKIVLGLAAFQITH